MKKNSGLTLIELMVVAVILGIIMLAVNEFLGNGLQFFSSNQAKLEIQRDARRIINLLNRNLRQSRASSIVISSYDTNQPPWSYISFETIDNKSYHFYQKDTKMYMCDLTRGATQQIAENLRHLTFCYPMLPNDEIISISLCFEKYSLSRNVKSLQLSVEKVRIMNE
ncbi:MAG: hypothetical protein A3J83_07240 [Elusimicrobia bacterium RIFOXYA2_FULL_40_6]|nr:MAG: hypothetical protein A3J83_07240 [Elusimicrobia bacterium RIFOXYA2_FULL_40_6]